MAYTIEEKNQERQELLAKGLAPATLSALQKIVLPAGARILDLGCGQGETTRLLAKRFENARATGLDQNAALIEKAKTIPVPAGAELTFMTGDAQRLPFDDGVFDLVFTRYLLTHLPDPAAAISEMRRVCKAGGVVFAQEPDFIGGESYPPSEAYSRINKYFQSLFQDPFIGRKLPTLFRAAGLQKIYSAAFIGFQTQPPHTKKLIRLTAEAMAPAILERGLTTPAELGMLIAELQRLENDEETTYLTNPSVAAAGIK